MGKRESQAYPVIPTEEIRLRERTRTELPRDDLPQEVGEFLWRKYGDKVEVEFPSPKTGDHWWLTPGDWVGFVPIDRDLGVAFLPKVPIRNLFRMLEYAYRLDLLLPGGLTNAETLTEFYERLALILARRVLDRGRKGFYRRYVPEYDLLPFVRGRLDLRERCRRPWVVRVPCHYEEHTADIDDNRILAWTLHHIARNGACTERVLPTVRRSYRTIHGFTTLAPYTGWDCLDRVYDRLNDDYQPMHALCRFFLDHSGPMHERGDRVMLPFLINMAGLFEQFVAEWLRRNLSPSLKLEAQRRVPFGQGDVLNFQMDIVLRDARSGKALCVIDTKYKAPQSPDTGDVYQIVTYALALGAPSAVLLYPQRVPRPLVGPISDIHLDTLAFPLDADLEASGTEVLRRVGDQVGRDVAA